MTASDFSCEMWDLTLLSLLLWWVGSVLAAQALLPHSMWDLSSWTRDSTHVPCTGRGRS